MKKLIAILIGVILLAGCSTTPQKESDKVTEIDTYKMKSLDWYKIEPIVFLNFLKKGDAAFITIWKLPPSDWIKEKDVE